MNHPKRSLGQNFLIDPNYQRKIVSAFKKFAADTPVLEIGPGRGALTEHLVHFAKGLFLVEKDNEFSKECRKRYFGKAVTVFHEDFLDFNFATLPQEKISVIGNLPYNISSQILIRLLKNRHRFSHLVLMFQKEVAKRCLARPQTKDYSVFSVWVQYNANVQKICDVPSTVFRPRPKVTSTVLHFELKPGRFTESDQKFFDFVKLLFSQRRKKISTVLKHKGYSFEGLEDLCERRVEALTIPEMQFLFSRSKTKEGI